MNWIYTACFLHRVDLTDGKRQEQAANNVRYPKQVSKKSFILKPCSLDVDTLEVSS